MFRRLIRAVLVGSLLAVTSAVIGAAIAKRRIPSVGSEEDNEIALVAIFDALEFVGHAGAFRGGSILLWFGGGDIDLRDVRLDPTGAHLTVRTIFGGGRLMVPEAWDVDLRVPAIFGGAGDARPTVERAPDAPRLIVDGLTLFGGLGIFSSKPDIDTLAPDGATD